jgi:hypothetical protein
VIRVASGTVSDDFGVDLGAAIDRVLNSSSIRPRPSPITKPSRVASKDATPSPGVLRSTPYVRKPPIAIGVTVAPTRRDRTSASPY